MTLRFLCALSLLVAAAMAAIAQDQALSVNQSEEKYFELLIIMRNGTHTATFSLEKGGCLIGPLTFYDFDEKLQFKLEAGVEFPRGCGSLSKKIGE